MHSYWQLKSERPYSVKLLEMDDNKFQVEKGPEGQYMKRLKM